MSFAVPLRPRHVGLTLRGRRERARLRMGILDSTLPHRAAFLFARLAGQVRADCRDLGRLSVARRFLLVGGLAMSREAFCAQTCAALAAAGCVGMCPRPAYLQAPPNPRGESSTLGLWSAKATRNQCMHDVRASTIPGYHTLTPRSKKQYSIWSPTETLLL